MEGRFARYLGDRGFGEAAEPVDLEPGIGEERGSPGGLRRGGSGSGSGRQNAEFYGVPGGLPASLPAPRLR